MRFRRLARGIGFVLLGLLMVLIGAWCVLAIWYRCGVDEPVRTILAAAAVVFTLVAAGSLAMRSRWIVFAAYSAAVALLLVWWETIAPTNDRNWSPDVARSVTAAIDGDLVLVSNVRNFNWRTETDFDQVWEQRTYRLSQVTNVDLIMSYWMGEAIAHTTAVSSWNAAGVQRASDRTVAREPALLPLAND